MSDETEPKTKWKTHAKRVGVGGLSGASIAWMFWTFAEKDFVKLNFHQVRADTRAVEERVDTKVMAGFQTMQVQLEGIRTEQRRTNDRIDRVIEAKFKE